MDRIKHYSAFLIAGSAAAGANFLVLYLLSNVLGISPYFAQILGLWASITTSWWINRTWTFPAQNSPSVKEYFSYVASMLVSSAVNYLCFVLVLQVDPFFTANPAIALIPSTCVSMFVSYFGMKLFVFKKTPE